MWTVLTYAYNSILILFIAAHLLVGAIISFLTGLYIGIYLSQTYEIPRITEPSKVWERFILFMEQYRRRPRSSGSSFSSTLNLLHPKSVINIVKEDDDNEPLKRTSSPSIQLTGNNSDVHDSSSSPTTGGVILVDSDFGDVNEDSSTLRKSSSQILEATLIINSDKDTIPGIHRSNFETTSSAETMHFHKGNKGD